MKQQLHDEAHLLGRITKIEEYLVSLERKMDTLISRSVPNSVVAKPIPKPFQPSVNTSVQTNGGQNGRHKERIMHTTICADCKKECTVPFKPTGDRPVYCKDCFSRRKSGSSFNVKTEQAPKAPLPVQVVNEALNVTKPQVKEKKKVVAVKKSATKKKVAPKKNRKR